MRHLTEFYGMDLEMPIDAHYHECMKIIDGVLKHIFKGIQQRNRREVQVVKSRFPHEDLVIPDETVILRYTEGVKLLRESGYKKEDGSEVEEDEDFDTPTEKYLGKLVKEKYNTDYYILDKFPSEVRPFYTMPDPEDKKWSNSFDIFVRGQEILSGGQRIHDSKMLEAKMRAGGVEPSLFGEYTQAFKYGAPPHAGGGIGECQCSALSIFAGTNGGRLSRSRSRAVGYVDTTAWKYSTCIHVPSVSSMIFGRQTCLTDILYAALLVIRNRSLNPTSRLQWFVQSWDETEQCLPLKT
jgi:hypothetical protein